MNTNAVSYYVSFDNYTVGKLQGQYIEDQLNLKTTDKKYTMEITAGDPADNNATFFYKGAMDVLQPYIDKGTLVVKSGQTSFEEVATAQWDTPKAMNRMQNILASYYADGTQLDICLCSNDSTALGVTQAIESDYKGTNTPLITGQDGDEANLKNLLDGKQSMTVYKAVANEAVATLDLAKEIMFLNSASAPDILVCLNDADSESASQAAVDYNEVGKVRIIAYYTSDKVMEEALAKDSDIVGVMCGNDDIATRVVQTLSEHQMAGRVAVVGQDAELSACQRIVENTQTMTVFKQVEDMADIAARMCVDLVNGKSVTDTSLSYYTTETINDGMARFFRWRAIPSDRSAFSPFPRWDASIVTC